jgi:hypothetical protein
MHSDALRCTTRFQHSQQESPGFRGFLVELAGLEPATSWVRCWRSVDRKTALPKPFSRAIRNSPNIIPNKMLRVLQYDNVPPAPA